MNDKNGQKHKNNTNNIKCRVHVLDFKGLGGQLLRVTFWPV